MSKIVTLPEFRRKAQFSQSELGKFLRTTPSQISKAEKGQRPLSGKAIERLEKLKVLSMNAMEIPDEEKLVIEEKKHSLKTRSDKYWRKVLRDNKWTHYLKMKSLQKMRDEEAGAFILCHTLRAALSILTESNAAPQEKEYFTERLDNAYDKLTACSKVAQLNLQVEIDLLTAEASILNQYLGDTTVAPGEIM